MTGAGDMFVGAFATACAEGDGIGYCLNFATRAASINVRRLRTWEGIAWGRWGTGAEV